MAVFVNLVALALLITKKKKMMPLIDKNGGHNDEHGARLKPCLVYKNISLTSSGFIKNRIGL